MKKKNVTLTAGVLVLGLLSGAYLMLKQYNQKTEEAEAEQASGDVILELDTADVTAASFTISDTEYTFQKEGDEWTLENDAAYPVDSDALLNSLAALAPLKALRTLEEAEDSSEYGMDEPQNKITVTLSDGTETIITIGDTNANTSDDYVMLNEDSSVIYTVDSSLRNGFASDLMEYALSEKFPTILTTEITGIRLESAENVYELKQENDIWMLLDQQESQHELEAENQTEPEEQSEVASQTEAEGQTAADEETTDTLLSKIAGLYFYDFLEYNCEDLSVYGLEEPSAVLTVTWQTEDEEEQTVIVKIGSMDTAGNYYVQVDDSTQVHTMLSAGIEALMECTVEELQEKETETESESTEIDTETESESIEIDTETESESIEIDTDIESESTEIDTETESESIEIDTETESESTEIDTETESESIKINTETSGS